MAKSRKGGFTKDGDFTEIRIEKSSSYDHVAAVAAEAIDLASEDDDDSEMELYLFRTDGTVVPNQPITLAKESVPWTLQHYLKSLKKTAAQINLGVGYRSKVKI